MPFSQANIDRLSYFFCVLIGVCGAVLLLLSIIFIAFAEQFAEFAEAERFADAETADALVESHSILVYRGTTCGGRPETQRNARSTDVDIENSRDNRNSLVHGRTAVRRSTVCHDTKV